MNSEYVNLIEIRRAKNGYVVSVWRDSPHSDHTGPRGYQTHVCVDKPESLGALISGIAKANPFTDEIFIRPARATT